MNRATKLVGIFFAAVVVTVMLGLCLAQPARADEPDWTWQNPLPQGNTLFGVWGSSGSDVFAVGENGTILYYDGDKVVANIYLPIVLKN